MTKDTTKTAAVAADIMLFDNWFDPIENGVRERVRGFIETMLEEELEPQNGLGRRRCRDHRRLPARASQACADGHVRKDGDRRAASPHPGRERQDQRVEERVAPGLSAPHQGRRRSDRRRLSRRDQHASRAPCVECRFRRGDRKGRGQPRLAQGERRLGSLDRLLGEEPIVRLILDGTVVRVRLDKKATSISLLVALGVRRDGQKVLLAIKNMGGESEAAWRALLDDLVKRGLQTPELVIVDGAPGLEKALAALWSDIAVQRCTVHKHRNLLAHAPERLHEEISNDYKDMIYADTKQEVEAKRKAFIRKWRLKHKPVADSLEEAGDKLLTFTRFPPSQWKSIRTSNAIERLHEEFKRRIKTQTVLPSADTAAMLFWALLASGQITMRKVAGWQSLAERPSDQPIDLAA
jgi:putative transposase